MKLPEPLLIALAWLSGLLVGLAPALVLLYVFTRPIS